MSPSTISGGTSSAPPQRDRRDVGSRAQRVPPAGRLEPRRQVQADGRIVRLRHAELQALGAGAGRPRGDGLDEQPAGAEAARGRIDPHRVEVRQRRVGLAHDADREADPPPVLVDRHERRLPGRALPARGEGAPVLLGPCGLLVVRGAEGLGRVEQRAQPQVTQLLPVVGLRTHDPHAHQPNERARTSACPAERDGARGLQTAGAGELGVGGRGAQRELQRLAPEVAAGAGRRGRARRRARRGTSPRCRPGTARGRRGDPPSRSRRAPPARRRRRPRHEAGVPVAAGALAELARGRDGALPRVGRARPAAPPPRARSPSRRRAGPTARAGGAPPRSRAPPSRRPRGPRRRPRGSRSSGAPGGSDPLIVSQPAPGSASATACTVSTHEASGTSDPCS